jgi:hypothetical protein
MKTQHILKFMGLIALVQSIVLSGCKDKVVLPYQPIDSYTQIYMPEAVNGPIIKTLKITDSVQTLIYGANYGGQGYPGNDILVNFTVNKALADSFNVANKTDYPVMPDGSYTLSANTAIIPKGKVSTTPLTISVKTNGTSAMDALKTYILPVGISGSPVKVREALRTTFYILKAQPDFNDYPNYDRANWAIIGFSSQEANGEGPDNGRAIFALDGNTSTFWHTQWSGASPGPPHYIIIDMKEAKTLHGVSFVGRQADGGGKPNEVNIQVSLDNTTWTDAGTFNLLNNKDLQKQFLPNGFKSARYIKVIISSAYNGSYTQVAEFNAF